MQRRNLAGFLEAGHQNSPYAVQTVILLGKYPWYSIDLFNIYSNFIRFYWLQFI